MNERTYNNEIERLRSPERIERLEISRVAERIIKDNSVNSILDIGTGSGLFAGEFVKNKMNVTGIDSNLKMIESAKELVPNGIFKEAAAEALPFEDKSFDVAFMGLVFHEVDDYLKALREAGRVSRLGVYILEWPYKTEDAGPPLEHRLKREFVEQTAIQAGFSKVEVTELKKLVLYSIYW